MATSVAHDRRATLERDQYERGFEKSLCGMILEHRTCEIGAGAAVRHALQTAQAIAALTQTPRWRTAFFAGD